LRGTHRWAIIKRRNRQDFFANDARIRERSSALRAIRRKGYPINISLEITQKRFTRDLYEKVLCNARVSVRACVKNIFPFFWYKKEKINLDQSWYFMFADSARDIFVT